MDILLIYPPVTRPSEPPAGVARLAGALNENKCSYLVLDANIEGLIHIATTTDTTGQDTWTRRAGKHLDKNLDSLRDGTAFRNTGRYRQAVNEINRILEAGSHGNDARITLNNYTQRSLSPVRSTDLLYAAQHPQQNIFYPYFSRRFSELLKEHAPRIIGFSLNYLNQALTCFAMIGFVRNIYPQGKIVLGGGLVTSWTSMSLPGDLFSGLIDNIVAGPGEAYLLKLAGVEYSGKPPLPDYTSLSSNAYLSPGRVIPYSTSSGCYWGNCSFCPEKAEGSRYTPMPSDRAVSDILTIEQRQSPSLIHVCDNAISPKILASLAERGSTTPWYGFARITHHLADEDFCRALKRSGCVMIKLGLESGDQDVLDNLCKGLDLNIAIKALKTLKNAGIATYVYLLFGTPAEDETRARNTLDFLAKYSCSIDFLNLSIFNLPRQSEESSRLETYEFSEGDLSLYQGFIHPRAWSRQKVRQFIDKEFKRHPAVARILRNDPPIFTSNHAPFFVMNRTCQ